MNEKLVKECKIIVDGGCKGNGTANAKGYGSYAVYVNGVQQRIEHFDLPDAKTSNEAEFASLAQAFVYIQSNDLRERLPWLIQMDSNLVVNMVTGVWSGKDARMKALAKEMIDWMVLRPRVTLEKTERVNVVNAVGH